MDDYNNYYTNEISRLKTGYEEAKTKLTNLNISIMALITSLEESSGDDIDEMISDLTSFHTSIKKIIDDIDTQLEKNRVRAEKFDGWYQKYKKKADNKEIVGTDELKGFLWCNRDKHRVNYDKVYINSSGLIEIDYKVYLRQTYLWGLIQGEEREITEAEAKENVVENMVTHVRYKDEGEREEIAYEMGSFDGGKLNDGEVITLPTGRRGH